jgi:hypothetical protein
MAVTLNASTSSGLVSTADTSGIITLQNNGTNALTVDSGNLQFNSGYGSVATAYGCRAWVNFNGTGTVAIRASGNVTSITDNGTGDYTVNFTTAMPDANYSAIGSYENSNILAGGQLQAYTTTNLQMINSNSSNTAVDGQFLCIAIFR